MKKFMVPLLSFLLFFSICTVRPTQAIVEAVTPAPAVLSTLEPTPELTPEPTPVPPAEPVAFRVGCNEYRSDAEPENTIIASLTTSTPVTLESDVPFSQLYLRWSTPPDVYTLTADGFTLPCGQNHYLHELITLPESRCSVTLSISSGALQLMHSALFTEGVLSSWVQDWQPPLEKADLMVLSTHNDDDILFFGGAESYYAAELGYGVQVVYFTDQISRFPRMNECLNALWYMGIRHYPVFGIFSDFKAGSIEAYYDRIPPEAGKAYLAENIRRFRPAVLVTQDVNGEYGHMEHTYMLSLFREVIEETADADKYPGSADLYGVWDVPKTYIHLWGDAEGQTVMDWDKPLTSFDGLPAIEVARNAYQYHATEFSKGKHLVELRNALYSSYRFGLYRSLVGEDEAKNDFFEHIEVISHG